MNYEQKYKEVLSRAKKYWESPRTCIDIDVLTDIFPELKESEDERIRKEIIAVFKGEISYTSEEDVQKYIAWLEKQDEKKSADSYCQKNCKGFQETGKCFADGECKAKIEAEQNHTWSEEDEKIYNEIIDFFLGDIGTRCATIDKQRHFGFWLKSLKDRFQLQPKQEWSEDDKAMLLHIIEHFEWFHKEFRPDVPTFEIDWLKSLKPNHWKPSEQNIKDLEWCADLVKDKMGVGFHRLQVFIDELKNL